MAKTRSPKTPSSVAKAKKTVKKTPVSVTLHKVRGAKKSSRARKSSADSVASPVKSEAEEEFIATPTKTRSGRLSKKASPKKATPNKKVLTN
jgi:hypothetical protein